MATPFEGLLGNTIELRIIEFLLPFQDLEFNITELVEESGVSKPSVIKVISKFKEWKMVRSNDLNGVEHYSINPDSPYVKIIERFNTAIIEEIIEDETLYAINDHFKDIEKQNSKQIELDQTVDFTIRPSRKSFDFKYGQDEQRDFNLPLFIGQQKQFGGIPDVT